MAQQQEYIGLDDFFRIFAKHWKLTIVFTLCFFLVGFFAMQYSRDVYQSESTIASVGLEKGFSDESGHDILAVARLPIVYKEASLRIVDQDLAGNGNLIAGKTISAEQKQRLRGIIKDKLQVIAKNDVYSLNLQNKDEALLAEILNYPTYDERVLRRNMQVNFIGKSAMVEITYRSYDPAKAAQVINILTDVFVPKYNKIYAQKVADRSIARLEQERIAVEQEYSARGQALELINQRLAAKDNRTTYITIQKMRQNPRIEQLEAQLKQTTSREDAARIEAQIQQQLALVWVNDEQLQYIDPDTKQLLQDQVRAEILFQDAAAKLTIIRNSISSYRYEYSSMIPKALNVLNYGEIPSTGEKPITLIHVLILGFIGFFLANWFIFALEAAHPNLKISELEKKTGQKIVAMLPISYKTLNPEKELSYLFMLLTKNKMKTLYFTSLNYKEGKTHVSGEVADYAATELRKKVLLIDANHNNPALGRKFSLPKIGFSDLLADPSQAVEITKFKENFSILSFGSLSLAIHLNNLAQGKSFEELLKKFEQEYDYVIIDGPNTDLKTLDFLPAAVNVFMVHDAQKSAGQGSLDVYSNYPQLLKGIVVNYAGEKQLQAYYGANYKKAKSVQKISLGRFVWRVLRYFYSRSRNVLSKIRQSLVLYAKKNSW